MDILKSNINENTLLYPISMNYGKKDWNIVAALREFLSNMLDTKSGYNYYYKDGYAYISDKGIGLTKKDFIFGESTRDDSQIGQFGEGMKMALITLLRENRKVKIITAGFTVNIEKIYSKEYESEVMLLHFENNSEDRGTTVICECYQQEFEESVNLFLDLNSDAEKIDNNLYLPAGDIYIMGLKTGTIPNALFSYNIVDKTITNRDRKFISVQGLQYNIISILRDMNNQKAIRVYLENFETNPTAYEYQLAFIPFHKEQWRKVLSKIYTNGKVCLSSDLQSDLTAHVNGYKVFRHVPFNVNNILKSLDVPLSSDVTKEYSDTGSGLFKKEKIIYPISVDYCSNWTIKDALREFIANALDTGTNIRIEHKDGKGRIIDSGRGILKKHFIFGISEGKGKDDIGQFGEGLKLASLVFARDKRDVEIQTIGYTYSAQVERNNEFDTDLFTVYFKRNQRKEGTIISFDCTEVELEEAKQLFSYFRDGRKKTIYADNLDIFFDEPGAIYVNGLKTATIDSIFGYNVKDKFLVAARDRNTVDTMRLSYYIEDYLRTTSDEYVIEEFLTAWKRNRYYIEYRTEFSPLNIDVWTKVAQKIYKKACIESNNYDQDDNFISKQAGYEILKNLPSILINILSKCGIKTAESIAKKYRNKGIIFEDKVVYPIAADYAKNWTIKDAIRELIANALDTETKVSISVKDGVAMISDKGEGIAKRNLLFGNSEKTDDQIGQFGEGLKMASLVLAKQDRNFHLVTKGYEYHAKIERDEEFQSDILVLYLKKSKKRIGTDITFLCSDEEMNKTKELFLTFNKKFRELSYGIYSPGGYIFVNGVLIEKSGLLFSYNLQNVKDCLSRDRKSINMDVVKQELSVLLGMSKSEYVITKFFYDVDFYNHAEHSLDIFISSDAIETWKKVVKKLYPKCCLPAYSEYDVAAIDKGYKLISYLSNAQLNVLKRVEMPYSYDVATLRGDESVVKKRGDVKNLSEEGRKRWNLAIRIFKKLYGNELAKKCEIAEEFNSFEVSENTTGYYYENNDTIYILKNLIEDESYSFAQLMGTFIHEHIHRISGASDRTREFENALSEELGRLAELLIRK